MNYLDIKKFKTELEGIYMTYSESIRRTLASKIAKREGRKSEASIGDIREIVKILVHMDAECKIDNKISILKALEVESSDLAKDPKFIKKYLKTNGDK